MNKDQKTKRSNHWLMHLDQCCIFQYISPETLLKMLESVGAFLQSLVWRMLKSCYHFVELSKSCCLWKKYKSMHCKDPWKEVDVKWFMYLGAYKQILSSYLVDTCVFETHCVCRSSRLASLRVCWALTWPQAVKMKVWRAEVGWVREGYARTVKTVGGREEMAW